MGIGDYVWMGVSTTGRMNTVTVELKREMNRMKKEMEGMRRMMVEMYYAPGMPGFVKAGEKFEENLKDGNT